MGRKYVGYTMMVLGVLALAACEVDPDIDRPGKPTVPDAGGDNGGGDTGGGDNGDSGNDDSDTDPTEPSGTACIGHCDCALNEYCAAVGVCQLMVVPGPYYCCSQPERCVAGQECHEADSEDGVGICPSTD